MKKIQVKFANYMGIRSGAASAVLLEEKDFVKDNEIFMIAPDYSDERAQGYVPVVVSANVIVTHEENSFVKKNIQIVFVSVIRLAYHDE